jgi:hypothetical protein
MKNGPLTSDEVRHLDHRWCVLQSFADVGVYKNAVGHSKEGRIYRGCKDGAIATCRALSARFSIKIRTDDWSTLKPCTPEFKSKVKAVYSGSTDAQCEALWKVLVAANRCVCHLEDKLVDHEVDDAALNSAVQLVQAMVRQNLRAAGLSSSICI